MACEMPHPVEAPKLLPGEYEHCDKPEPLSDDEEEVPSMSTTTTNSLSRKSKVQLPVKLPPVTAQRINILDHAACLV